MMVQFYLWATNTVLT